MHIGILGAGRIGGTLGGRWAAAGHDVLFGVRDPQADDVLALLGRITGHARAGSVGCTTGRRPDRAPMSSFQMVVRVVPIAPDGVQIVVDQAQRLDRHIVGLEERKDGHVVQ